MSECGLEVLDVDTFLDLGNLKWLDLSNNHIKTIQANTFRGLALDHLFLNGNRNIQLLPGSFDGLFVAGLYLHECSLKSLRPEVIESLNGTLTNLWLNGNELERLDKSLLGVFASFQHMRLGSNPIHCSCEAIWLKEFYDGSVEVFKGATQPSCTQPARLKGKHFGDLSLADFRCHAPVFNNIDVMFTPAHGRLKCSATGEPIPTLFWIQPSGKTTKYGPTSLGEGSLRADGVLDLHIEQAAEQASMMGMYICVAKNEAGNITLAINVSWPTPEGEQTSHGGHRHSNSGSHPQSVTMDNKSQHLQSPTAARLPSTLIVDKLNGFVETDLVTLSSLGTKVELGSELHRLFSVTELVLAVVATHVFTLLLALLLVLLYYRRRTKLRHNQEVLLTDRGIASPLNKIKTSDIVSSSPGDKCSSVPASDILYHNTANFNYGNKNGSLVYPPPPRSIRHN